MDHFVPMLISKMAILEFFMVVNIPHFLLEDMICALKWTWIADPDTIYKLEEQEK